MTMNRLEDYLNHIRRAAFDAISFNGVLRKLERLPAAPA